MTGNTIGEKWTAGAGAGGEAHRICLRSPHFR
jgi:hypothetical protein